MKKILRVILMLTLVFSLVACSGQDKTNTNSTESSSSSQANSTESDNAGNETNDDTIIENTENDTNDDMITENTEDETTNDNKQITFEKLTVVNNDECVIKITGIEPDNMMGFTLNAYLENKSSEKTYMFSVTSAAVNGVQSDPFFASEVAAGKKSNEQISFTDSTLEENGIHEFTDIELSFRVYDSDDWMADPVAEETIHIYPYGEENVMPFEREAKSSDNVIIDNEYVTAIVTGYEDDSILGYTANLFLVNKTDKEIMFSVDDASVNGYMADPFFATSVSAGKCAFSSMSWANTTLEENGITNIEEIEITLRAYNSDDWMADDFANEKITLNP